METESLRLDVDAESGKIMITFVGGFCGGNFYELLQCKITPHSFWRITNSSKIALRAYVALENESATALPL
ncbi:hypothetical protein D6V26_07250 [Vibrio cholerae]|nr:hypothetical protein [Vibrio cholerae]